MLFGLRMFKNLKTNRNAIIIFLVPVFGLQVWFMNCQSGFATSCFRLVSLQTLL